MEHRETLLETDDEIRQALLANSPVARESTLIERRPAAGASPSSRPAQAFRPTGRPAFPLLTVYDDGKSEGEVIRIRSRKFVIGRTEGDLRMGLDRRISSRHVEITHQSVGGKHCWVVTDLQSKHGLFVRVSHAVLGDKAEILVGKGRYRFDFPQPPTMIPTESAPPELDSSKTEGWSERAAAPIAPSITEIVGKEVGNRILLVKPEYWIGSDANCSIERSNDPFCEPRHARLFRSSNGTWHAENNKTQNGLWLRMPQVKVESTVQFQIGEQRFQLKTK